MLRLQIGGRNVGQACFSIAEAGSNHNGDLSQAKRLVEIAAEAGADAVKFQTFRAERLYPKSAGVSEYLGRPESIYDIIVHMEMPYEWIPELADHAKRHSIQFLSTPFDEESADRWTPSYPRSKLLRTR